MITITLQYDASKPHLINGFNVSGHSGYSEAGSDIICSAVSAVTQTALLGLLEYAPENVQYQVKNGLLTVRMTRVNAETTVILKTMILGLEQIAQQYGTYVVLNR